MTELNTETRPQGTVCRLLEAREPVDLTVTAQVRKLCPVKDEVDEGTVTLTWQRQRWLPELHDLALYLRSYADLPMTHEDYSLWRYMAGIVWRRIRDRQEIARDLLSVEGVGDGTV